MTTEKKLYVLGQNLFFLPRIMNEAEKAGLNMRLTNTEADFWKAYEEQTPTLVLVDLEGDTEVWPAVLRELQTRETAASLVAFGPHSDTEGMELARNLGCDKVLSKGEFSRDMQQVIGEHAESGVR